MSQIVVIGGGIAGLAAAWEAARAGADVVLHEATGRVGGVIVTERINGCVVEGGPDGFLGGAPDIPDLCAALGIADRVVGQERRDVLLAEGGKLDVLPPGKAAEILELAAGEAESSAWFLSLKDGMGELVDALARALEGRIRLSSPVRSLPSGGETVILAAPAAAAAQLLEQRDPAMRALLLADEMVSSAGVVLALPRSAVRHPLDASGFVVPRRAAGAVVACTFVSSKFPGRAPAGTVLLRAHVGRFGRSELLEADDATLVREVSRELSSILGISGAPSWTRVFRFPRALPRRDPRREGRLRELHERAARAGLLVAGAAFGGVGLSACVRSGREAGLAAVKGALVA